MRLIDADALLSSFDVRKVVEYDESGCGVDYKAVPVEAIANAPAINPEPVRHGRWALVHEELSECSACGMIRNIRTQFAWTYCPNCGAKMDLEVRL